MQANQTRALVTGAAGGIGQAICRMLLEAGAPRVGMLDLREAELASARQCLAGEFSPESVESFAADIRQEAQVCQAVERFVAWAGGISLLVSCAGVLLDGAVASVSFRGLKRYPLEQWESTIGTNLTGAFLVSREAVAAMLRTTPLPGEPRGLIVTISSVSRSGRAGQAAYSSGKGALVSFALSLSQELAPYRIRSVAVAPGLVDTPMAASIPEAHRKDMLARTAAGRMGRPEEIAHAVRFCLENEFFSGRVLEIDGGAY